MRMDDRKKRILAAVVDEYILTGEPVGSKAIACKPDINVSAATVRNDMAMLEQLGFLEQPHTSAGRVPTFSGYRFYIDNIMQTDALPESEVERLDRLLAEDGAVTEDLIVQSAATALSELTQCAVVASSSMPKFSVISKVEVIPTGKRLYVVLLVTSDGSIKNKACRLEFDLTNEQLEFFSNFIEENLKGLSIEELSDETFSRLAEAMGAYIMTLSPLMDEVRKLSEDLSKEEFTIKGERNLLACGELDKNDIVRFMDKSAAAEAVRGLLDRSFSGINVMFSEENDRFVIGNSSMIVSHYKKGDKTAGSLGIIGPVRLDYAKIIPYIEYFTNKISALLSDDEDDKGSSEK